MLENEHPERMPRFFESKEAAEIEQANRREAASNEQDSNEEQES